MGTRAINARWFRTVEPQEQFDYFDQRIDVDNMRERMLTRLLDVGLIEGPQLIDIRKQIIEQLVAPPPTRFEKLLWELCRLMERRYLDWADSPYYVGLSTLLEVKP